MYLEGMQWVLSYYTLKVPDWEWSYKYDYAPNLTSIIEAMSFKLAVERNAEPLKKKIININYFL